MTGKFKHTTKQYKSSNWLNSFITATKFALKLSQTLYSLAGKSR